jgi:tetratricopeptide (TPR) repeat protein
LVVESGLTRDELTERVGTISDSALDRYLSGVSDRATRDADRPSNEHIASLAAALAPRIQGASLQQLSTALRLHYSISEIAELVAGVVGWRLVDEAVTVFLRAWRAADSSLAPNPSDALRALLSGAGEADALGVELIALPLGSRWAEAASACRTNWFGYLMYEARRTERLGDAPFDVSVAPSSAASWALRGWFSLALVDDAAALTCFRKAAALSPNDPELHLDLACALDGALVHDGPGGERRRLAEALLEVRIALGLRPRWDEALREEAMLLDAMGDAAASRGILEGLAGAVEDRTEASFRVYQLAVLHFEAGRYQAALGALRNLLRDRPDHADALALASCCEASLGNAGKARTRAAQAGALGLPFKPRERQ